MEAEQQGGNGSPEYEIQALTVLDDASSLQPHCLTFIGDFSNNSLIFDGANVVRMPKGTTRLLEPSLDPAEAVPCMKESTKVAAVCTENSGNIAGDVAATKDGAEVYLSSILDLFTNLNARMEALMHEKRGERRMLEEAYKSLLLGDHRRVLAMMQPYIDIEISDIDKLRCFISRDCREQILGLKEAFMSVKETVMRMQRMFGWVTDKLQKKADDCERLRDVIQSENAERAAQIGILVAENGSLKDGLLELVKKYGSEDALESKLESDLLNAVGALLRKQENEIANLRAEGLRKSMEIDELGRKVLDLDITNLSKQLSERVKNEKRLQAENLGFSETIQRLSEKHVRYKQDFVVLNNELKRAIDTIKAKNETIQRQKTLIELFQDKISGSIEYPIEELRSRRREIEKRIVNEQDYFKREHLLKEKVDCDKRLSDFMKLQSKKFTG